MIRKLRTRFIASAMISVFLVLFILMSLINIMNYINLINEADYTISLIAENGGTFPSEYKISNENESRIRHRRPEISPELPYRARFFSTRYNSDGELIFTDLRRIASLNEDDAIKLSKTVYLSNCEKGFVQNFRYLRQNKNEECILVFLDCFSEINTFRKALLMSSTISLIGFAAVFVLILIFSKRIIRPISESYEKQKRFITDAGHELKTPITIINADADVLEAELLESNEWLDDIRKQTSRLTRLTNDLVYLSKMQEDDAKVLKSVFSISEIAADTCQSFYAVAISKNKKFAYSIQPDLLMLGDEQAITKLLTILIDNAIKYSPEGGIIRLNVKKDGKTILIHAYNTTDNIEKGSANYLFDRFYRTDASRNSETGGFGLGLSVAKAVVEAHRGKISAVSEDGNSLSVEVSIPIS